MLVSCFADRDDEAIAGEIDLHPHAGLVIALAPAASRPLVPKISVATYELDNVAVLNNPAYRAIGGDNLSVWSKRIVARVKMLMRYEGEQILPGDATAPKNAAALLLNAMSVPAEHEHEFNEWYNTEHIPALAAVPGTLWARRYRGEGAAQRYVALYHLESPEVPESAAWKKAANTPWTERMRPHFRDHLRIVSRRYIRTH
ncbi:MAG: hypothetical protein WA633_10850 [Stellaceae bacterium]